MIATTSERRPIVDGEIAYMVNFPKLVSILSRVGFDGVLCVELDNPRVCGFRSAAISRQYLRDELGL